MQSIFIKTLLSLCEINMKNKLIAVVEEISFSEDKAKNTNAKEYVHFNCGVILLNFKELKK